jgi:hypothetical protein
MNLFLALFMVLAFDSPNALGDSYGRQEAGRGGKGLPVVGCRAEERNLEAEVRWKHGVAAGCRAEERRVLRLHLEEATVYAFEFRPVAQSGPA